MKSARAWIVTGMLFALVAFAARSHAAQEADDAFKTQFQKALDAGQKPEQQKLVRSDARNAELWIVRLSEVLSEHPDPGQQAFLDALCANWRSLFPGEFPDRVIKYFAGLDAGKRKIRVDLMQRWKIAWRDFENNVEKKDGLALANGVDEIDALSGAFESEGDLFHASEAYRAFAMSYDETLRGAAADLHRAWQGYGHAVEMREKLDLKDAIYDELVKRKAALTARGADKKGGATPGPAEPAPGAGAWPSRLRPRPRPRSRLSARAAGELRCLHASDLRLRRDLRDVERARPAGQGRRDHVQHDQRVPADRAQRSQRHPLRHRRRQAGRREDPDDRQHRAGQGADRAREGQEAPLGLLRRHRRAEGQLPGHRGQPRARRQAVRDLHARRGDRRRHLRTSCA